ncbi:MAG TPA: hypothetical protein VMS93_02755 [Candidatus Saccharimonadales bacterium]|nr:hypothetical protein [Candidatus Saccharimonadales bacterium]
MKRLTLVLLAAVALIALGGCGSSNLSSPSSSNPNVGDATLTSILPLDQSDDPLASGMLGGTDSGPDETVDGAPGLLPGSAMLQDVLPDSSRILWWRKVTSFTTNFSKSGTPDSVFVVAQRTNTGQFLGLVHLAHPRRDSLLYRKDYQMSWTRSAIYTKQPVPTANCEENTHWLLKSLTLADGVTPGVSSPAISRVVVSGNGQSGPTSVTFDDPTKMYQPGSLPLFQIGDSILVQVFTDGSDANQRAFIHFDIAASDKGRTWRRPMAYNPATGAFEGSFVVREGWGKNHFGMVRPRSAVWVDVLSKATIYDTTAPYAANCWGVPYRLFRHQGDGLALN